MQAGYRRSLFHFPYNKKTAAEQLRGGLSFSVSFLWFHWANEPQSMNHLLLCAVSSTGCFTASPFLPSKSRPQPVGYRHHHNGEQREAVKRAGRPQPQATGP